MTIISGGDAYARAPNARASLMAALCAALLCVAPAPALAHGGHDHGTDSAALEIRSLNRATAQSEAYQLVAVLNREMLVFTIDRLATNEPVRGATVSVMVGTVQKAAAFRPDGTYAMPAPELARPGRHELVVSIADGNVSDLLITAIDVPEPQKVPGKPRIVADAPSRLSDGSVFLPKATQRLVGVRTEPAVSLTIAPAVTLVGRIIADPNRSAVVQSTIAGRIAAIDGALPRLGQPVTAGQVLAIVTPSFAAIDSSNVAQTGGELDQMIALAQNKVDQFRPLVRNNTLSVERLRTVEIELENLKKRRATLATSQRGAEQLSSPVDGVIAGMRALPGQVVSPQDVLFQIVDPKSLWVEALAFDPTVPQLAGEATAAAAGATILKLSFIGRSRALQQLSTVIHFSVIDPPASLNIGSPVTVYAHTLDRVSGLVLPKSAVVSAASGESVIWVHTEPERFQPRAVKVRAIDGERVVVEAGIEPADRAVTVAAELLNQVR
jgi:membrane fusion protein, heavy metal efflux system